MKVISRPVLFPVCVCAFAQVTQRKTKCIYIGYFQEKNGLFMMMSCHKSCWWACTVTVVITVISSPPFYAFLVHKFLCILIWLYNQLKAIVAIFPSPLYPSRTKRKNGKSVKRQNGSFLEDLICEETSF